MNPDYIKRINKSLNFIETNLENNLSLEIIAELVSYSPFHLHRIFKAITNETLNSYVNRKRIEKAAQILIHKKEMPISEIAMETGFANNSSLTKSFVKLYGKSPTEFRKSHTSKISKIGKNLSKNGKLKHITEEYICNINNHLNWIKMNANVEIKELPKMELAYITQIGVDGIQNAFNTILKWARPKGLLEAKEANLIRIFHDSNKITDPDKIRMSIGVILDKLIATDGGIGIATIESGKHIVGHFEIKLEEFEMAWDSLILWMDDKGYRKSDRFPFEIYYNNYLEHPEKKCIVDFCIPLD